MVSKADDAADPGIVQTEMRGDLLQGVRAAAVGGGDCAVPFRVNTGIVVQREWRWAELGAWAARQVSALASSLLPGHYS
jgi:hypothetical protein